MILKCTACKRRIAFGRKRSKKCMCGKTNTRKEVRAQIVLKEFYGKGIDR